VLGTDGYRAGAKVLSDMGLVLDNSFYFPQAGELADFARAVPDLPIIVNHIGGLARVGPYANRDDQVLPEWRKGVEEMAKCPNIVMKLGGVGQTRFAYGWDQLEKPIGSEDLAAQLSPLMEHCIQQFGPDRCMFESNYPVDKISYSYNVLWNAFKRLSSGYSATERAAMFHDTAARVYNTNV